MKIMTILILLIIGLHHPMFTQGQITITSYPRPLLVQIGASFTLSCDYNSYTFHSWIHPTLGEVTSSHGRLELDNIMSVHIAKLDVHSSTFEDEGVYACRAATDSNIILNQTISAMVFEGVQIITESMLTYEARLCETVVLNCSALHHDSITWRLRLTYDQTPRVISSSNDGRISVLSESGQLVIRDAKQNDNGTYFCAASNRVNTEEITAYLNIDLHPPENITVNISNTGSTALLTFTWSPVITEPSCLVHYQIHATNCGVCPSTVANLTAVTCEVSDLTPEEEMCTFVVQTMINGENASKASSPFTVILRVPDTPVANCVPHYSYPGGNLTTVHCRLNSSSYALSNNIMIDLSPTSYTINYYDDDTPDDTPCGLSTIPASLCESECIFEFNVSLSLCPPTVDINITTHATNVLGSGPQSEPIVIKSYLNVSVYASIVNYTVYVIPLQSPTKNITYKLLYRLAETLDDCRLRDSQNNTMLQENNNIIITSTPLYDAAGGMLLFQLPTPSCQVNVVFCFELTVCVSDITTVVIEGSIDINGVGSMIGDTLLSSAITASTLSFTPKHTMSSIDTTTLIALCVIVIILTILTIMTLIIIIVRRKRKWRSGLSKTSNIYELDDIPAQISSTQINCSPQHSNNTQRDEDALIYADIVTSSGFTNNQFSIFMDDDKVEYAEIENGRPKNAPATTKTISDSARNTDLEREAIMGDHSIRSCPINLDNLLIQLRSQVTPKWYQFGLVVGIDKKVLDRYTSYSPEVCIIEVLDQWLRNRHTNPTWRDVADALKEIELYELAEKIVREHVSDS